MKNNTIIDHTAFAHFDSSIDNESEIEKKLQYIISKALPMDYGLLPLAI